jgi:hypothetical protein
MIGLILGLTGTVLAQDRGDGGGTADPGKGGDEEKPVIVKDLAQYEALLKDLWNDDTPGIVYQLAPGSTQIYAPGRGGLEKVGKVVTKKANPEWPWGVVTEDWILYNPEELLIGELDLEWCCAGNVDAVVAEYAALPDAAMYGHLTFEFTYQAPPTTSSILGLPTMIPWWVDDIQEFAVLTETTSGTVQSGTLYREVYTPPVVFGDPSPPIPRWRDVWVLWQNYQFPNGTNGVTTVLQPLTIPDRTVRAYLQSQPPTQNLFVQASSAVQDL